jgi:hypothetical protein
LTCDFWAENGKNKTTAETNATNSVASPFGLPDLARREAVKPGSTSEARAKAKQMRGLVASLRMTTAVGMTRKLKATAMGNSDGQCKARAAAARLLA